MGGLMKRLALADGVAPLFTHNCTPCHGKNASANTPAGKSTKAKDLRSPEVQKKPDEELASQTRNGKGPMPGFKARLKESEVSELVAYIRALVKK